MVALLSTTKDISVVAKKYCRLVVTEDAPGWHRLVERADGVLEYRMGAGKWKAMTPRKFRVFLRSIVQAAKSHQIEHLAVQLSNSHFPKLDTYGEAWVLSTIAENFLLAAYEFDTYKSKKKDTKQLKEIVICGGMNKTAAAGFARGQVVAEAANLTRTIANTPACDMTPRLLAKAAKDALKGTGATVEVLGEAALRQLKMNLLLAVGQGTKEPTQLIVMKHNGGKKGEQPIVLIGKGITYDTGGLNVKPTGAMHDMHLDMSGGAGIIGAMYGVAKLGLKKNVIGIVPAAENAISDSSMRAGDIITAMNGTTVEVIHTDAEGRLALADALTYAERFKPKAIIDTATLTGAALVALGQHASALMTKDDALREQLQTLGEETGDYVWPLPLWDEYKQHLKSARADIANINASFNKFGGAIEGGIFLSHFAPKKVPWAHIDIAPRMDSIPSDKLAKGSTGEPVRLLVKFVEEY